MRCPKCNITLAWTGSGPGWMNSDQWGATKAGDYFIAGPCGSGSACAGAPHANGNIYFWESKIGKLNDEEAKRMGWT